MFRKLLRRIAARRLRRREKRPVSIQQGAIVINSFIEQHRRPGRTLVIGVCGPSAAGKSVLTGKLNGQIINLDNFYKEGHEIEKHKLSFYDSKSNDIQEAAERLRELLSTGSTTIPTYDLRIWKRTGEHKVVRPDVLIVEGLFVFSPEIYPILDLRVFVDSPPQTRIMRRQERRKQGIRKFKTLDEELKEFPDTEVHETRNILSKKKLADLVIHN